jgi:predicted ribosomally synthesized peptide with nif11-like leader
MSLAIFEKVKEFLIRIVKDEAFRSQLMSAKVEEVKQALENGGYSFSQKEFETAAIKILELKEQGQFDDLSEEELLGAFGGLKKLEADAQPLYGVIYWPPEDEYPKPYPDPQPMYGIVIDPIDYDPPVQALYGVVIADEELLLE